MDQQNSSYLLTPNDTEIKFSEKCPQYSLVFLNSPVDEEEMHVRGYVSHIYIVEVNEQKYWPLCFYDTVRLSQEVEDGKYIDDIGLIVVEIITLEIILMVCRDIVESIDFQKVKSYSKEEMKDVYNFDLFDL